MRFVAAAICSVLTACAAVNESKCIPRGKVLRTGGKPDGALVGVICSTERLERIIR
jgi:hypothetical protein